MRHFHDAYDKLYQDALKLACCLVALVLTCVPRSAVAVESESQAYLRRLLTGWKDYEGLVVTATVNMVDDQGKTTQTKRVRAMYGTSADERKLRPYCVGILVDNPGEPHLTEKELWESYFVFRDGIQGWFERRFISNPTPGMRMSSMLISTGTASSENITAFFHKLLQPGIDGVPMDSVFGSLEKAVNNLTLEILDETEFQGIPCKHIRYTYRDPALGGFAVELLVTTEPSVQVLKFLSSTSSIPRFANDTRNLFTPRKVHRFEVFLNRLFPSEFDVQWGETRYEYRDLQVEPLPAEGPYPWDFDNPTGTTFVGDIEKQIRTSRHEPLETLKQPYTRSQVPYTAQEQELIQKYLFADLQPVPTTTKGRGFAFYAVSVVSVCIFAFACVRRSRATNS